jgi:hypothetical protein
MRIYNDTQCPDFFVGTCSSDMWVCIIFFEGLRTITPSWYNHTSCCKSSRSSANGSLPRMFGLRFHRCHGLAGGTYYWYREDSRSNCQCTPYLLTDHRTIQRRKSTVATQLWNQRSRTTTINYGQHPHPIQFMAEFDKICAILSAKQWSEASEFRKSHTGKQTYNVRHVKLTCPWSSRAVERAQIINALKPMIPKLDHDAKDGELPMAMLCFVQGMHALMIWPILWHEFSYTDPACKISDRCCEMVSSTSTKWQVARSGWKGVSKHLRTWGWWGTWRPVNSDYHILVLGHLCGCLFAIASVVGACHYTDRMQWCSNIQTFNICNVLRQEQRLVRHNPCKHLFGYLANCQGSKLKG